MFAELVNANITVIAGLFLRRMLGVDVAYRFSVADRLARDENDKNRGKKKERKMKRVTEV